MSTSSEVDNKKPVNGLNLRRITKKDDESKLSPALLKEKEQLMADWCGQYVQQVNNPGNIGQVKYIFWKLRHGRQIPETVSLGRRSWRAAVRWHGYKKPVCFSISNLARVDSPPIYIEQTREDKRLNTRYYRHIAQTATKMI